MMGLFTTASSHKFRAACRILANPLDRGLVALGCRGPRSRETEWSAVVEQVIEDLESLNRSTEQDFLAVGGKLMEFLSVARQISSAMAALTELIAGEHGHNASRALNRLLERAGKMDARIEQNGQALASLGDLSCRLRLPFSKLEETVSVLRTLCTLTRIETARLGGSGSGFGDLADEVQPLSEGIQSSGQNVLEASSRLDQTVRSAQRTGSDLSARQLRDLRTLIADVVKSIQSFEERRQRAREASVRQAAQHAKVCAAIEDLVRSIQFHDITRQQIEHVSQALLQIRSEGRSGGERCSVPPPGAQAILALQSSQLSSAAQVFAASFERMERDLEGIAARVRDMAEASTTLMGFSAGERDSFFIGMENCFSGILSAFGACSSVESTMHSTDAELKETIRKMRESVEGIREVEIRIQRIAINATIRSAHIGAAGNALNVIADAMQRVTVDSNRNTEEAASVLDSMKGGGRDVSGASSGARPGGLPDTDDVLEEMRQAILELHSSSQRSFSRVNQITAISSRFADDIQSVRNGLSVGSLFAEAVARARGELERIATVEATAPSPAMDVTPTRNLERFAKHYTMQAERDVHEAMAGGAVTPSSPPTSEPRVGPEDGDLGDNVELF